MKLFKGRLIVSLVFVSALTLLSSKFSFALVPINTDIVKEKSLIKVNVWAIRCAAVQNLAEKKLDKFDGNKNKHFEIYITLKTKLNDMIDEWGDMGYDVTKLQGYQTELNGKIDEFSKDYEDYRSKLEEIEAIDCGDTETEYKNLIQEARNLLKEVRKDVVDIKTFYLTILRPHIVDLKKQVITGQED